MAMQELSGAASPLVKVTVRLLEAPPPTPQGWGQVGSFPEKSFVVTFWRMCCGILTSGHGCFASDLADLEQWSRWPWTRTITWSELCYCEKLHTFKQAQTFIWRLIPRNS